MGTIRKTVELAHPRAMVWETLVDPGALAIWLMPNDFEPTVGHAFTFRTDPAPGFDGTVYSEVLELEPPSRLVIAWRTGGLDTTVAFTLSETRDGTRLDLVHDGFALRQLPVRAILSTGWSRILRRKLPAVLASRGGPAHGA